MVKFCHFLKKKLLSEIYGLTKLHKKKNLFFIIKKVNTIGGQFSSTTAIVIQDIYYVKYCSVLTLIFATIPNKIKYTPFTNRGFLFLKDTTSKKMDIYSK